MLRRSRKGFTLFELIITIVILGIVSTVIATVFEFSDRSFTSSNELTQVQYELRRTMNEVKAALGVAINVDVHDVIPTSLPATGGYCYYDNAARCLRFRSADGVTTTYLDTLPDDLAASCKFTAVDIVTTDEDKFDTINLDWTIDNYQLLADVYIQNRLSHMGDITSIADVSGHPLPGIYIEFN